MLAIGVGVTPIYVSDRGRDDGLGTVRRPYRSLARVATRIGELRRNGVSGPIEVHLRGIFPVTEPLSLGTEASEVTLQGDGRATITGGVPLTGWRPVAVNGQAAYAAATPLGRRPRQLFAGRDRIPAAALGPFPLGGPIEGQANRDWMAPQDTARFRPSDVPPLAHPEDIDFVANHLWVQSRMGLRSIDRTTNLFRFDRPSVFRLGDGSGGGVTYRLENVAEALRPGAFVYDRTASEVRLSEATFREWTRRRMTPVVAVAPQLLVVRGAHHLRIQGLRFAYSEWTPPADRAGDGQAAISVPGAVSLLDCDHASVENCVFSHLGTYGLEVAGASHGNQVRGCLFADLGGGGVKIGPGTDETTVSECELREMGRLFESAVGVWIGDSGHNHVVHNFIHDLYYTGVSVGWTWGYGPSHAVANEISYNRIEDVGQGRLSDMGGIYTLGVSPGSVLSHNRIERVEATTYGGWGIYLDEGTSGMRVEDNLVIQTKTGGFHQHYGQDNLIRNNVFLNARQEGQIIRTRQEDHRSFTFEGNVVQWRGTDAFAGAWGAGVRLDRNLYWRTDGQPATFGGRPFAAWQATGQDPSSRVADPELIVNANGVSFRPGSSAFALGIHPIDLSHVGPRQRLPRG